MSARLKEALIRKGSRVSERGREREAGASLNAVRPTFHGVEEVKRGEEKEERRGSHRAASII